jgi:hypothetical protein
MRSASENIYTINIAHKYFIMKYHRQVNLPPIPTELLRFRSSIDPSQVITVDDIGYGYNHKKGNRDLVSCGYVRARIKDYKPLMDWLNQNIPYLDPSLIVIAQMQTSKETMPSTHIVHSDIGREFALNYIIDTGGDAITSWYRENSKPMTRTKIQGGQQSDSGFVDYNNLEILESAVLEKNKWYLISTNVLHDVDNIVGSRKSISISIQKTNTELLKFLGITNDTE